jgi:hypothetical protein
MTLHGITTCYSQKTWHLGEKKTLEEVKQCYFLHDQTKLISEVIHLCKEY